MSDENLPWVVKFQPKLIKDLADNIEALNELKLWLKKWEHGIPEKKAAFLIGPPGVGKTVSVHILANEMNFDVLEINASDYRTRTRMEELIGRAATQNITIFGKRRLILFDEMEGISGREDLGGIAAINDIIKETHSPIVLIATSLTEENEEKFRPLGEKSIIIEYHSIPTLNVYSKLAEIAKEAKIEISPEVLEALAIHSQGDLRSVINDFETIAFGRETVSFEDVKNLESRDRKEFTPIIIRNLFAARTLLEAKKAINQAYIGYEELFDWIYENIPLIVDDPGELIEALEALSQADIFDRRAKMFNYRLQKYMYNDMTAGVALSQSKSHGTDLTKQVQIIVSKLGYSTNIFSSNETINGLTVKPTRYLGDSWRSVNDAFRLLGAVWIRGGGAWLIPYIRPPQLKWRYIRTFTSRKKMQSVSAKVAAKLHISKSETVKEVIPLMHIMFRNKENAASISEWLGLEEEESDWLHG